MKSEFIVEKIGGTSMTEFAKVLKHIFNQQHHKVKSPYAPYGRVVIVSAYGGVTDLLLENKKTRAPGLYSYFLKRQHIALQQNKLFNHLKAINKKFEGIGLPLAKANAFIEQRIDELFRTLDDLTSVWATGYIIKENILLAAREMLASIGEVHAAYNTVLILKHYDYNAKFVDLSGIHDHRAKTIDWRINDAFKKLDLKTSLPIVTGYVKGTEGIMREFNRGYSEMTLAKIATRINAAKAIIYKEFHLSSADPKTVGANVAVPVGKTNYDVAGQLADVGMEAIHPSVAKILEAQNITLHIRNTFQPHHDGTVITKHYKGTKAKIEIIAGTRYVSLIEIHDPNMVGSVGFDYTVGAIFKEFQVSYVLKSTNANSISHIVWDKDISKPLIRHLTKSFYQITTHKVAIVSIIGTNIAIPGIMARAATALSRSNINILCMSQSFRQVNMQFVIERPLYTTAIKTLHDDLIINYQNSSK
ncbi:aspartate kinase [Spirochaetota bacterium]|nr:aspartate kinase [Spirochaetota bacterium]